MPARRRSSGSGSNAVCFEDRGALYVAPPEVVRDFMTQDQTYHAHAHKGSVRRFKSRMLSADSERLSWEQRDGRAWRRRSARMTRNRPAVHIQEDLDGRYAGTTRVFLYLPRGRQMRVDALCFMRSAERSPEQFEAWWRKNIADNFREDRPWLRKYARSLRIRA